VPSKSGIRGAIQIRNTRCHEREGMGERILCGSSEAAHVHRNQIQSDPISVQSVYNQCPIRDVHLPIHTHHLSVQSVYNQCTISVQSEMYISQSTPTIEAETRQLP
jgi:hypothetical protein